MVLNRRGIELPASMLVILIVSIVILGLAGGITYKFVCSSEDKLVSTEAQQASDVERRLASGPAVIIPDSTKSADQPSSLCGGNEVPGAAYSLGIRNDNSDPAQNAFTITCEYKGVDAADNPTSPCPGVSFRGADGTPVLVDPGKREILTVVANVDPSTPKGRNVYTLTVAGLESGDKKVNFYLDVS